MTDQRHDLRDPLRRLLGPRSFEVTCETCFAELDRYVELGLSGADAETLIPGMQAHLEGCSACREDHESLKAFVRADEGR